MAGQRISDFVAQCDGIKPIRRILIANNGMAARKFILSVREWCFHNFDDERLIQLVAMATPDDMKANSMHIHSADAFVEVPGGPNFNNYANVNLIARLATAHKCDAVWPGWGHASENPALPRALEERGVVFIGPTDRSMFLLGDKIASTIIAQSAGVPCVEWSGTGVAIETAADGSISVSDDVFASACVESAADALRAAEKIGYPIMIKASEGGGGKGVRKAVRPEEVELMYRQVVDEVKGSPVFLMRLCTGARHIEVQLLGDKHGNVAALSGRDCSMQRRYQKIVEEGPPTAVPPATMREMELAAARLCKMVGYTHAGTVEYLFVEETKKFYFLELNPRLQVEHPVTEGITGTNLPALQCMVAMGVDLSKLPEDQSVAAFIVDPDRPPPVGTDPFAKTRGHVIAVRITAENAADGWTPTVGGISEISFQPMPSVWGYFSVKAPEAAVHAFADSQFGHLFAHGPTRKAAARRLTLALRGLRVVGEIHTNVQYVQELLLQEDFVENRVHTAWLDAIIARQMQLQPPSENAVAICGGLLKTHLATKALEERLKKDYLWRNACPPPSSLSNLVECRVEFIWNQGKEALKLEFEVFRHSPEIFTLSANGSLAQAKLKVAPGGTFICSFGDETHAFHYELEPGDRIRMLLDGKVVYLENEKDPSQLVAPYGGKLASHGTASHSHTAASYAMPCHAMPCHAMPCHAVLWSAMPRSALLC